MAYNYVNPAFCQNEMLMEEVVGTTSASTVPTPSTRTTSTAGSMISTTPSKIQRSESSRSFHIGAMVTPPRKMGFQRAASERKQLFKHNDLPPKPGPKPQKYGSITSITTASITGKYALVPLEELTSSNKGRYAVLPEAEVEMIAAARIVKSQDNLDRIESHPINERPAMNLSDQCMSLPPSINSPPFEGQLVNAFSNDFNDSKSFILYDQKSMQRYEVVPTEENEELVDPNHEIIQMENGRVHRYAVIPADEDETCMNASNVGNDPPYSVIADHYNQQQHQRSPPKKPRAPPIGQSPVRYQQYQSLQDAASVTPRKNPAATQMLHDLLSTPQKQTRQMSTTPQSTPMRRPPPPPQPRLTSSTPKHELAPQRLHYEMTTSRQDVRTTAIISPRLQSQQSIYTETTTTGSSRKSWDSVQALKTSSASMTIGAISMMLILCGFLNAGLSLYVISKNGRSYFLDIGVIAGFASIALGSLGFKSRQCSWLPNRNYVSGYVLVTIFAILNCCGLLVLLWLDPFPGFPTHDVTSGVILGLSSLTVLIISLGVISSRWCQRVPIDARVDPV